MTSLIVVSLPPSAAPDSMGEPETRLKNWIEASIGASSGIASIALPDLKIGTLDNLVTQSEEVAKADSQLQNIVSKVHETIVSIHDNKEANVASSEKVEGRKASQYLQQFGWNMGKYRPDKPISELVEAVLTEGLSADSDLKQRYSLWQSAKSNLAGVERKQTGDLTVRSLNKLVTKRDLVLDSEYLTSTLVVVPNASNDKFLATYESITEMVVPRSAKKLSVDQDYTLYSVTLFRKFADEFAVKARENKYIIRDLEFSDDLASKAEEELKNAQAEEARLRNEVTRLASAAYADIIKAWGHIRVIRLFVESVLRYGLPPNYVTAAFVPKGSKDSAEKILVEKFSFLAGSAVKRNKQGKLVSEDLADYGALVEQDYKPFVVYAYELP